MRNAPLFLFILLVAGCAEPGSDDTPVTSDTAEADLPPLHGWVFDQAIRPMAGVDVQILETNQTAVTNGDGFYAFDGLPVGEPLVLVAQSAGFEPSSQAVTLPPDAPVRLNFTMVAVPVAVPSMDQISFNGLIACQTSVVASEEMVTDCADGGSDDVWEFAVEPELAGAVIEIAWEQGTDLSASMAARLETLGRGDANVVLAEAIGTSVLRLQINEDAAKKFYPSGGHVRLTVWVSPNVDENETGAGAGVAVNQEFQAIASIFYIEPPSPTFTAAG